MWSTKNIHHTVRQRVSSEEQTINACETHAFSVFSNMIIPVIAHNWEHLVPVISQSSNQSWFLSEEVSLVLVNIYKDVRALFIAIIFPVRMKHNWWECVIHVNRPPSEPHGFSPNSIGQQKWTENILLFLKHEPRWLPLFHPWDNPLQSGRIYQETSLSCAFLVKCARIWTEESLKLMEGSLLTLRSGCCRENPRRDTARYCRWSRKPVKARRETRSWDPSLEERTGGKRTRSFCRMQNLNF